MLSSTTTTYSKFSHAPATHGEVRNVNHLSTDAPDRSTPASGGVVSIPVACLHPEDGVPGSLVMSSDGQGGTLCHPDVDHRVRVHPPVLSTQIQTTFTRNMRGAPTPTAPSWAPNPRPPFETDEDQNPGMTLWPQCEPDEDQNTGQEAQTPSNDRNPGEPRQSGATQRPRNEANGTLIQPRRRRKDLKIASLNMNGRGTRSQDKWGSVNNVMKRWRIAILGLQETHPSEEMRETVGRRFRNALHIVHSANPNDPNTTGGVSIAVHKSMIDTRGITHRTIVPGRAILVEIPWNGSERLRVLNIYAPARNTNKAEFWKRLLNDINDDETLRPDIVLGDFNLVENPEIDRLNNRGGGRPPGGKKRDDGTHHGAQHGGWLETAKPQKTGIYLHWE